MENEKKATDVILEMNSKLDDVLAYVKNMDFKYNLILEKLNNTVKSVPIAQVVHSTKTPPILSAPSMEAFDFPNYETKSPPTPKTKLAIALEEASFDQEETDEVEQEKNPEGKKRNLRFYPNAQEKRIPVQQRICYSDGKNVSMANVEISDSNGVLIKETKTSNQGKWTATLPAGNYMVMVSKMPTNIKPKVELKFPIAVSDSDSIVELDLKKV